LLNTFIYCRYNITSFLTEYYIRLLYQQMNLLDFLYPKKCFGCGKGGSYICRRCHLKTETPKAFCPMCRRASIGGTTHTRCVRPRGMDSLISLFSYDGVIKKAIGELKYNFVEDCAGEMAGLCVLKLKDLYTNKDVILVPIPLHRSRERWRGFNQSASVGKHIAALMGWKFVPDLLERTSRTKPQVGLEKKLRKNNVKGVFKLNPNYKLRSPDYLLFDDVWTTGSTMKEACKALKRSGAKTVWGLTIAG